MRWGRFQPSQAFQHPRRGFALLLRALWCRPEVEARFGASLESVVPAGEARATQLDVLKAGLENVHKEIEKHAGEGALFFGGEKPCFADVQLAATLKSPLMGFAQEYDVCAAILENEWAAKYLEAFEKWASIEQ